MTVIHFPPATPPTPQAPDTAAPSEAWPRIVQFFEQLQASDVARLGQLYAADAYFKDPFNEVRGVPAIEGVFVHMFQALHEPRFVITHQLAQGQEAFLSWDFVFRFKGLGGPQLQTVRGVTHLRLDPQGRIAWHRDYWDAAEELYEKLPGLGTLMRWLKRRARS
ncbi:nuclear transport factor 2 family protein [Curvibacter sp. HBC61]|uniref:Nuclear transport factor 2 family protein n=1 Tax=Curvibacter cyanobacteriorum TaxID=3026422 RepID=A0ABT5MZV8_9BURK|nr:nuclear transport factor 2 family protein [Curvibacter sp. HBC61]MDD0839405.1 nuclear transport factor 2 family protein [Curvibacter sp. HBC61]